MTKKIKNSKSRIGIWSALFDFFRAHKSLGVFVQGNERIVRTDSGFEVNQGAEFCWKICWDEVCGVYAYKLDALTVDVICFAFQRVHRNDAVWCIHEDMPGFKDLIGDIEQLTEGGWPAKFRDIAAPAFEFNWTVLWRAPSADSLAENPMLFQWKPIPDDPLKEQVLDRSE